MSTFFIGPDLLLHKHVYSFLSKGTSKLGEVPNQHRVVNLWHFGGVIERFDTIDLILFCLKLLSVTAFNSCQHRIEGSRFCHHTLTANHKIN